MLRLGEHDSLPLFEEGPACALDESHLVSNQAAQRWIHFSLLACIFLQHGQQPLAQRALIAASNHLSRALRDDDHMLLIAAGLLITILHMHDQGNFATQILQSAYSVAAGYLRPRDPLCKTFNYLLCSADTSGKMLGSQHIDSDSLASIYRGFQRRLGPDHPYTIAARYNYAWMLRHGNWTRDAECHARAVHGQAVQTWGPSHIQSVTSLALLAGCLDLQQGKERECVETYARVAALVEPLLGVLHPYTLEARRRQAVKMLNLSGPENYGTAVLVSQMVLLGRIVALGIQHPYTIGQKYFLRNTLEQYGRQNQPINEAFNAQVDGLFSPGIDARTTMVHLIDAAKLSLPRSLTSDSLLHTDCKDWCYTTLAQCRVLCQTDLRRTFPMVF